MYHITGGTFTIIDGEAHCRADGECVAADGSPVVGERLRALAYGVNCSGGNLSPDVRSPGICLGKVTVECAADNLANDLTVEFVDEVLTDVAL